MLKVLALLSWFVASPIFALGYEAKYDVVWNMGIRLEAEAIETLKQSGSFISSQFRDHPPIERGC